MKTAILPSAHDDLAAGFGFYERQREGLGSYFRECLFSDIESLQLYAGIHLKVFGFRRLLSKRFPYAIYYDQEGERFAFGPCLIVGKTPRQSIAACQGFAREYPFLASPSHRGVI